MDFEATKMKLSSAIVAPVERIEVGQSVDGGAIINFHNDQSTIGIQVSFRNQSCERFGIDVCISMAVDGDDMQTEWFHYSSFTKRWLNDSKPIFWDDQHFQLVDRAQNIVNTVNKL